MPFSEADIVINGTPLTLGQSICIRVAVTQFLINLNDPNFMEDLGDIGPICKTNLLDIQRLILKTPA